MIKAKKVTAETQSQFQIVPFGKKVFIRNVFGKYLKSKEGKLSWSSTFPEPELEMSLEHISGETAFKTWDEKYFSAADDGEIVLVDAIDTRTMFKIETFCKTGNLCFLDRIFNEHLLLRSTGYFYIRNIEEKYLVRDTDTENVRLMSLEENNCRTTRPTLFRWEGDNLVYEDGKEQVLYLNSKCFKLFEN